MPFLSLLRLLVRNAEDAMCWPTYIVPVPYRQHRLRLPSLALSLSLSSNSPLLTLCSSVLAFCIVLSFRSLQSHPFLCSLEWFCAFFTPWAIVSKKADATVWPAEMAHIDEVITSLCCLPLVIQLMVFVALITSNCTVLSLFNVHVMVYSSLLKCFRVPTAGFKRQSPLKLNWKINMILGCLWTSF